MTTYGGNDFITPFVAPNAANFPTTVFAEDLGTFSYVTATAIAAINAQSLISFNSIQAMATVAVSAQALFTYQLIESVAIPIATTQDLTITSFITYESTYVVPVEVGCFT